MKQLEWDRFASVNMTAPTCTQAGVLEIPRYGNPGSFCTVFGSFHQWACSLTNDRLSYPVNVALQDLASLAQSES